MKAGKAIVLFILGLVLAFLVFPIAWAVSIALGYVFAIVSIILGACLIAKREGRTLPLVLGIILLIIAVPALLGTAVIHIGLWTVKEAVEEATETKSITAHIGEAIKASNWEITVLEVKGTEYIKKGDFYYGAKEGKRLVLIKIRIKNIGDKSETALDIRGFTLVSNENKSYEKAYTSELDLIPSWKVTDEIKSKVVVFEELDRGVSIAPNTVIEGDLLFQIPVGEEPAKLYFKVGVFGGYEVTIELTK